MRIHSNKLTRGDFHNAVMAAGAGVFVERLTEHGSRSRARAFDFLLSGHGITGGQWASVDYVAATWDEWGILLNYLFSVDPDARVAKVYEGADHFHWATGGRFRTLTPQAQHKRHNWLSGDGGGRSVDGAYYVQSCRCGALRRWISYGHNLSEVFDTV